MPLIIKDEIAACRMSMKLWSELSQRNATVFFNKVQICDELFGDDVMHNCPCCEFVMQHYGSDEDSPTLLNCKKCPMTDFWSNSHENEFGYTCENSDSPYGLWRLKVIGNFGDISPEYRAKEISVLALKAMQYWQAMKEMNITW